MSKTFDLDRINKLYSKYNVKIETPKMIEDAFNEIVNTYYPSDSEDPYEKLGDEIIHPNLKRSEFIKIITPVFKFSLTPNPEVNIKKFNKTLDMIYPKGSETPIEEYKDFPTRSEFIEIIESLPEIKELDEDSICSYFEGDPWEVNYNKLKAFETLSTLDNRCYRGVAVGDVILKWREENLPNGGRRVFKDPVVIDDMVFERSDIAHWETEVYIDENGKEQIRYIIPLEDIIDEDEIDSWNEFWDKL